MPTQGCFNLSHHKYVMAAMKMSLGPDAVHRLTETKAGKVGVSVFVLLINLCFGLLLKCWLPELLQCWLLGWILRAGFPDSASPQSWSRPVPSVDPVDGLPSSLDFLPEARSSGAMLNKASSDRSQAGRLVCSVLVHRLWVEASSEKLLSLQPPQTELYVSGALMIQHLQTLPGWQSLWML
ncbi:hypothetical protein AOLI_G00010770 [Acnodon oligacanthus]